MSCIYIYIYRERERDTHRKRLNVHGGERECERYRKPLQLSRRKPLR